MAVERKAHNWHRGKGVDWRLEICCVCGAERRRLREGFAYEYRRPSEEKEETWFWQAMPRDPPCVTLATEKENGAPC